MRPAMDRLPGQPGRPQRDGDAHADPETGSRRTVRGPTSRKLTASATPETRSAACSGARRRRRRRQRATADASPVRRRARPACSTPTRTGRRSTCSARGRRRARTIRRRSSRRRSSGLGGFRRARMPEPGDHDRRAGHQRRGNPEGDERPGRDGVHQASDRGSQRALIRVAPCEVATSDQEVQLVPVIPISVGAGEEHDDTAPAIASKPPRQRSVGDLPSSHVPGLRWRSGDDRDSIGSCRCARKGHGGAVPRGQSGSRHPTGRERSGPGRMRPCPASRG